MEIALACLVVIAASMLSGIWEQRRAARAHKRTLEPQSRYFRFSITLPDTGGQSTPAKTGASAEALKR